MFIGLNGLISGSRLRLSFRSFPGLFSSPLPHTTQRFRTGSGFKRISSKPFKHRQQRAPSVVERPQLILSLDDHQGIIKYFEENVRTWSERRAVHARLHSFGIPEIDIDPLLNLFAAQVQAGKLSGHQAFDKYSLDRFARATPEDTPETYTDFVYTAILYAWAADPTNEVIRDIIQSSTITSILRLFEAARMDHPADQFYEARRKRRTVIMHVGPTNSGKTYHALRALATADTGVYAGPLRLLAYEIWERLNLGQIVPAGVEEDQAPTPQTTDTALDVIQASAAPNIRTKENPKFARACNLITGEEHRIVDELAPLESATVEMLSLVKKYDVAVVDEIQMIADVERGFAWTTAVLGLNAKELHLCGEETAVPIVRALLADTQDQLIIRRYDRLTPLRIGASLSNDFSKVEKGDCVVTFSRKNIFFVKQAIEKATKMKCAVVYGKLPPEVRSDQAALFNDPDSGYDVIVGSDAIGMGLNLKIRRIIFEAVSKYDGHVQRLLSISQVKQIAGRAGRYGMVQEASGTATTLSPEDLPLVEKALAMPFKPLSAAILGPTYQSAQAVVQALPSSSRMQTIYDAHAYVTKTKSYFRLSAGNMSRAGEFVDQWAGSLSLEDRMLLLMAPVPWSDERCYPVMRNLVRTYSEDLSVPLLPLFDGTPYVRTLLMVEDKMANLPYPKSSPDILYSLEIFHKLLSLYAWLSLRNPVAYHESTVLDEWKPRAERALHWALKGVTRYSKHDVPVGERADKIESVSAADLRKKRKESEMVRKKVRVTDEIRVLAGRIEA
ncbi:hypothetical protein D9757_000836 [Collybiopsis confluens]|uniref:Helicase C-terminal domain-containing protein n=1 Tax=Collybiopsis confluens TaxID=2823264 RepID=A0A8H5I0A6_9AGAR|nr:hypothetical protein D9757_000836 [Collybiopsis confluens]